MIFVPDIRRAYRLFMKAKFDELLVCFGPDAQYRQLNLGKIAIGHDQIKGGMIDWFYWLGGIQIACLRIKAAPVYIDEQPGANQCFIANYTISGRCLDACLGVRVGERASIVARDTMWFSQDDLVLRLENRMNLRSI